MCRLRENWPRRAETPPITTMKATGASSARIAKPKPTNIGQNAGPGDMRKDDVMTKKCPHCESPAPHLHPAVQLEGEVEVCAHDFHLVETPQNMPAYIAAVHAKRARQESAP